jgi:dTDP-4-amino-4,6-dideoxygalactose transaminase
VESKRTLAQKYEDFFKNYDNIEFIKEPQNSKSNYWLKATILKDIKKRDEFLEFTNKNGVMTRPIWKLINELEMFKDSQCDELKNSKYLEQRVVNISSSVVI